MFKKKPELEYDEDELDPEKEEQEAIERAIPKREKRYPEIRKEEKKKDRFMANYQPEVLFISDSENPDRPILIKQSSVLEQEYPMLTLQAKKLSYLDRLEKSV